MSKTKNAKSFNRPKVDNSRKALRKQKRLEKKQHKQEHYKKQKTFKKQPEYTAGRFVKRPAEDVETEVQVKKKKLKPQPTLQDIVNRERSKDLKETNKLKSQIEAQRRKMLVQANEDEDRMIKKLEKQLGLNKSKNKNNYFADDGLDYLLEICDRSTTEQIVAAEKHLAQVDADSDFEDDLATVTGKGLPKNKNKVKSHDESESESGEGESNNDDESSGDDEDFDDDFNDENFNNKTSKSHDETNESSSSDNESIGGKDEESDDENEEFSDEGEEADDLEGGSDSDVPEEKPTKLKKSKQKEPEKTQNKSKEKIIKAEDLSKVFSDDEISHLSGDDEDLDGFSGDEDDESGANEKKEEKPDVWEDIYGRKRDKEGNIIKEEKGVYIPPHLRNKDSSDDKQLEQLKRQVKSVLNKLTGTNLHWACNTIETLYSSHSRHSVHSSLYCVWRDACVSDTQAPARLVTEHAALLAVLHANVGLEVGAHFLQELCKKFDELMETPQPMEDKRLDNLVSCLALLYGFKIYHATLLYDILNRLVEHLTEKNIDCIIVALRSVGGVLRKEEPQQLRQFIQTTQGSVQGVSEAAADGSRIKFLLEVLLAVKNNNLTKIPNYDPTYLEQLRKMSRTIVRRGNYVTPLNISLEDLLKADERGKWWVVGSAWEGTNLKPQTNTPVQNNTHDQKLLELARKQRMNTDVRRNIFCVIMAAEDYMDAFEKLQHLGLKGQQEREVVHVLLACCLQEKIYNPYYAVLGQKLCDFDRKYQLSIQFSVWDRIKDIENQSKQCLSNLAQFLTHLIMEKGLPLSVLKVIQFSDLNKASVRFMRQILLTVIMNQDLQSSLEVFHRISKSPKLHMFRESLKLFIQHFLLKNAGKKSSVLSEKEMELLKERVVEVNKILTMFESKLKL